MEKVEEEEEEEEETIRQEVLAEVRRKRERCGGSRQAQTDPCAW